MLKTSLIFPSKHDAYKGYIECRKCHNDKLQVKMVGPIDGEELTHVDFYCPICGDFVMHFTVTPYVKKADGWVALINKDPRIYVNEEKDEFDIDLDEDLLK